MHLKRMFGLAFWVLLAVCPLRAQSIPADELRVTTQAYHPPPPPSLRVQTNLVEVPVVVRDAAGKLVGGLRQSDFQIFDNGKLQTISTFSAETPVRASAAQAGASAATPDSTSAAPPRRYVALFFDDLNMPTGDLVPVRKAAQDFIRNDLETGDRVGIFTSSTEVSLGFTEDMRKVQEVLALLRPHSRRVGASASCPRTMTPYQAHQIATFEDQESIRLGIEQGIAERCFTRDPMQVVMQASAVRNQALQLMSVVDDQSRDTLSTLKNVLQYVGKFSGRRMIVLTSSGFLTMSTALRRSQDNLVEIALRTGVVIHSLDAKGLLVDAAAWDAGNGPPVQLPRPDLQMLTESLAREQSAQMSDPLSFLAGGTGGRFFHNNNDFAGGLREVTATPGVLYMLGYAPDNLKADSSYHTIKVTLTVAEKCKLDARRGYFAPERIIVPPVMLPDRFDAAVLGADALTELPVVLTARPEKSAAGESILRVQLRVSARELPFLRRDDRNVENLRFVLALYSSAGSFLSGVEGEMALSLKDETLARLGEQGLEQGLSLRIPPGAYRLRLVMQELMHGRMAAESRSVEIQ